MYQPELGKKIVQLRKSLNLTQEELAIKSSLGLRTIQRIESGGVMPRNSTVDLLLTTLGVDRQSLENYQIKGHSKNKVNDFFMIGDFTNDTLYSAIQMAWISGIFYLLILIIENGLEYLILIESQVESTFTASYILIKFWVLVSLSLFMRGYIVLSKVFESSLLRISSYVMIGVMAGLVFSDIVKIIFIENEDLKVVLTVSQSFIVGFASIFFGIALLRLQDSFGILSKYVGITEIILGSCFVLVFFAPIALALLVPVTVLEIVILYKGSEFTKLELIKDR